MSTQHFSIAVRHESLAKASTPVMVGHYENDVIASAEAFLDQCLSGSLSERLAVGLYAGRLPSTELVLQANANPRGAVVLGLGVWGKLNKSQLFEAYLHAFTRYALDHTHIESHQLSTVLIGVQALPLASCLEVLLDAIAQSNQLLAKERRSQLSHLDIFEIDAYTALECSDVLYRWQQDGRQVYQLQHTLDALPYEALRNQILSRSDHNAIWWQPLELTETASGEPPVIEDLPKQWQNHIPKHITLQVNEQSAMSAWEVLLVDQQTLGEYAAVVRQFHDVPVLSTHIPKVCPQVLWLGQEAPTISSLQWQGKSAKTAESALCALYENDAQVWHWQGGMQMTSAGCQLVLDQQVVMLEQLTQLPYCPELLCLSLSKIELSADLIVMLKRYLQWGVKALVLNTQPVSDESQQCFYQALYGQLLAGEMWGVAVQKARQQLAKQDDHAWVFQAYGQPDYCLTSK